MLKKVMVAVIAFACIGGTDAPARGNSSHSGGGSSHSSSRGSSKNSHYIARSCKTSACFKKHPSGTYGFMTGQRKRN